MMNRSLVLLALLFGLGMQQVTAAPYFAITPLTGVAQITFDEVVLQKHQVITNEYAAYGLLFSGPAYYSSYYGGSFEIPGEAVNGAHVSNAGNQLYGSGPLTLGFVKPVTGAVVGINAAWIPTTFIVEALLAGVPVEQFEVSFSWVPTYEFYLGFTGSLFDSLRITNTSSYAEIIIDHVQINEVPLPAGVILFGSSLLALAGGARHAAGRAAAV